MTPPRPSLAELGRDLTRVGRGRVVAALVLPFLLAGAYFAFASLGLWLPAVGCVVALSFVTYGSVSHDLVHRCYRLPRSVNDALLTAIELLLLRSGRAYRLAHLNHHTRYPDPHDDPEAAGAHGTLWQAVCGGPFFFAGLWLWAARRYPRHRPRLLAEAGAIALFAGAAATAAVAGWTVLPAVYVGLAYLGTWVVPVVTAYVPHSPRGGTELFQTRRFRGRLARLVALDHLYHLEHHLYPAVPHQNWPELARRLDPYLDCQGVPVVRIGTGPGGAACATPRTT
ncbi:fatty acid desaturase family protein [Gemmata sp.]|uniref:fatty acid desaturase family protein n=1 Tax=Gemmata sp. TaxID=1914242 RepID=UPI003F6FA8E3